MGKKKFADVVLKALPNLVLVDGYFVEIPILHIACGFSYERPPSGTYIWRFVFPLYYRTDKLGLMFSDRLPRPHGHIPGSRWNDSELAAEFVRRVEPFREVVRALGTLIGFKHYLEESGALRSPFIRRGYALTLIMLGEVEEATQHLKVLRSVTGIERGHPNFHSENDEVLRCLSNGLESAQTLLLQWEAETRQRLGLPVMTSGL